MRHFDSDYIAQVMRRLGKIPSNAQPRWGTMTRDTLIRHFVWELRHAMGRSNRTPDCSTWFTRSILKPLLLKGWVGVSPRLGLPNRLMNQGVFPFEDGDIETLQALMEDYLLLVQTDELESISHPVLGKMGIDEWDRFHVLHFEYHFRQFGV